MSDYELLMSPSVRQALGKLPPMIGEALLDRLDAMAQTPTRLLGLQRTPQRTIGTLDRYDTFNLNDGPMQYTLRLRLRLDLAQKRLLVRELESFRSGAN